MLLDIVLGNRTAWKILALFSESPGKSLARKEIKEFTKIGNKVLVKNLRIMSKEGLLSYEKIGRNFIYRLNFNNPFVEKIVEIVKKEKELTNNLSFNLFNILREFVYEIINISYENILMVYVFGSQVKRTARRDSDIDIAIVVSKKNPGEELLITEICRKIKKRFKVNIQTHYFSANEFDLKNKSKLVLDIIRDGVRLF